MRKCSWMRRRSKRMIDESNKKVDRRACLPPRKSKEPRRNDDQNKVENEESKQHPDISPPILIPDTQRTEEVVSDGVWAILATRGSVGIIEVSTERRNKLFGPLGARLTRWRVENGEFVGLALDLEPVKLSGDHRTQDASVRIEVVQPTPSPSRDRGERNGNAAKGRKDGRKERIEQNGDLDRRGDGSDELRKGDTEQLDEDEDEELESSAVEAGRSLTESDGVNHQDPVQNGAKDRVRNLGDQLGNGERHRRVNPTVVFPDKGHPVENPQRCQLSLDDSR